MCGYVEEPYNGFLRCSRLALLSEGRRVCEIIAH
jgi:hypothetical protein